MAREEVITYCFSAQSVHIRILCSVQKPSLCVCDSLCKESLLYSQMHHYWLISDFLLLKKQKGSNTVINHNVMALQSALKQ